MKECCPRVYISEGDERVKAPLTSRISKLDSSGVSLSRESCSAAREEDEEVKACR